MSEPIYQGEVTNGDHEVKKPPYELTTTVIDDQIIEAVRYDEILEMGRLWGTETAESLYTVGGRKQTEDVVKKLEVKKKGDYRRLFISQESLKSQVLSDLDSHFAHIGINSEETKMPDLEHRRAVSAARKYIKDGHPPRRDGKPWGNQFEKRVYEKSFENSWTGVLEQSPFQEEIKTGNGRPYYIPSPTLRS